MKVKLSIRMGRKGDRERGTVVGVRRAKLSISKTAVLLGFFPEYSAFTLFKRPPEKPDLNPIEHLWDAVGRDVRVLEVQPTNLQQLCGAVMSMWIIICEQSFQLFVKSMTNVLKAKGIPT